MKDYLDKEEKEWSTAREYYKTVHELTDAIIEARGSMDCMNYVKLLDILFDRTCYRVWKSREDEDYKTMREELWALWKWAWNPEHKGGKSGAVEKSRLYDDLTEWEHQYFWLLYKSGVLGWLPDERGEPGDNP